jgi:hypothetical protein
MTTEQYRQSLSQMTPLEADQESAEAEEYERLERDACGCVCRIN